MNKLAFLDVETTGLEDEDRLCQLAYVTTEGETHEELFRPPLPIKVGAMAISHITNHHVAGKPSFDNSPTKARLLQMVEEGYTLVAHNAKFDAAMLAKEGIVFDKVICSMKLARTIDTEEKMENYRLQYLRYFFDVRMDDAVAHDAMGDVRVLEAVFHHLYKMKYPSTNWEENLVDMLDIYRKPMLFQSIPFGKYKGAKIKDVLLSNSDYLEWLLGEKTNDDDVDWVYTLQYWLGRLPVESE